MDPLMLASADLLRCFHVHVKQACAGARVLIELMKHTSYQSVEPIPDEVPLLRPYEVPNRGAGRYRRVMLALVMSVMLAGCVVGFASHKSRRTASKKSLKGTTAAHPTLLLAKHQTHDAVKHQTHDAVTREYKLDGAKDGDDDTCETSDAITNYDSFKTQEECDSCCSEECSDYVSSDDAYLWMCESSYTSSTCSYTYDTYTIYKTPLCYACCETDCTRYISGEAHTVYFCS